jgi:DNA-3-methyladenine glycosylase II
MPRIIATIDDILEGMEALAARCEVVRRLQGLTDTPPLRRSLTGFDGLLKIIVGQQVSVAAANAIWSKFATHFPDRTPEVLLLTADEALRGAGLSAPKARTIRAIASALQEGSLVLEDLASMPADEAKAQMVVVKGIGPWTADIYLMFCLGHADAFAPGDLALQEAIKIAFKLPERPDARETALIAERWRPWRAVAARWLWDYYKVAKSREGVAG